MQGKVSPSVAGFGLKGTGGGEAAEALGGGGFGVEKRRRDRRRRFSLQGEKTWSVF